MAEHYEYEKYDEDFKTHWCPINDNDGSITGHIVIGVKQWFDENPEERKRLGWIKHISYDKPQDAGIEYDPQTQYVIVTKEMPDEYTMVDVFHVMDKSEEQMLFEEMLEVAQNIYTTERSFGGITFIGG